MMPEIDKLSKEYNTKALISKVDIDVNGAVAKEHNIMSVPALVLYKDGKKVWQNNGAMSYNEIKAQIDKFH